MFKIFRKLFGNRRKDVIVDVQAEGERRTFNVVREVESGSRNDLIQPKPKSKVKRAQKKRKRKDAKRKRLKK
jgi:hypothetical protein